MIDWPKPMVISEKVRDLKNSFLDTFTGKAEEEPTHDLNYIVAVSSGKAVTEEIPQQIGRRAGWASMQGANFVELLIENPAQLIMDRDMLVNLADRLDLHYNIHSSTSLAYGMSYRVGRGNGYDRAHEYTTKLLKSIGRFRKDLENRPGLEERMEESDIPILYAINAHMAVAEIPPEDERFATDLSVDPFGRDIHDSEIFEIPEVRVGIFKHFIWEFLGVGEDYQDFFRVLNAMEGAKDPQEYIQTNLVDILVERGYLSDDFLALVSRAQDSLPDELDLRRLFNVSRLQDLPSNVESLKSHTNARGIAQALATSDPRGQLADMPEDDRAFILGQLDIDSLDDIPRKDVLTLVGDEWEAMEEEARQGLTNLNGEGVGGNAYEDVVEFLWGRREGDPVKGMRNLARSRRLFQDEFNMESSIFRHIIPLWMPFARQEQVREMWEGITGRTSGSPEELIEWIYESSQEGMKDPRDEEDIIAAATGAYVWGHFTQRPEGYEQTFMELLEEADMYLSFESHMAGDIENARIWKPKDFVEVVKAINETPIRRTTEEGEVEGPIPRTRVTIDMEHIATQKIDPMWVIDPDEEARAEGFDKGLEEGDGKHIMIQHVTHPYIGEGGHHHGPIRRGDTLVYEYIYRLMEKGMMKDPDKPTVVMYEIGSEKDETLYMLRLMLKMIEHDIKPEVLEGPEATEIINKDEPEDLREYMIQKFFGVTDTEVQHEWQEIFEHALDPLDDMLEVPEGGHTWMGRAALDRGKRPEDWQEEEWQ